MINGWFGIRIVFLMGIYCRILLIKQDSNDYFIFYGHSDTYSQNKVKKMLNIDRSFEIFKWNNYLHCILFCPCTMTFLKHYNLSPETFFSQATISFCQNACYIIFPDINDTFNTHRCKKYNQLFWNGIYVRSSY